MSHPNTDDTRYVRLVWLPAIAAGTLAALLIWPQTHRLVASQLKLTVPLPSSIAAASPLGYMDNQVAQYAAPILRKCAQNHADDVLLQIAAATTVPPVSTDESTVSRAVSSVVLDSNLKILRLRKLIPLYKDSPALYATILRYQTQGQVRVTRDEVSLFLPDSDHPVAMRPGQAIHSLPEYISNYEEDCLAAEQLDPDNAFFPMMHTVSLFEAHRDRDALAELDRASECTKWNEYLMDELTGEVSLQSEAFGPPDPLTRAAFGAGLLLPHLASFRAGAKLAMYEAVQAELAGNFAEGLRIRTAVRRIGSLMRSNSRNLIGSLVAINLVRLSLTRPCGRPAGPKVDVFTQKDARDKLMSSFDSYLASANALQYIPAVHAEVEACTNTRSIISKGIGQSVYDTDMYRVLWLSLIDMIVLSSTLWVAVVAGLVCLLALVGASAPVKKLSVHNRLALMAALTVALGTFTTMILVQQANISVGTVQRAGGLWFSGSDGTPSIPVMIAYIGNYYLAAIAMIPVMMLFTLAILCFVWQAPVAAGVARGVRGCAVPICSIMVIGYCILAATTATVESRFEYRLSQTFEHEGRATAQTVGVEWPASIR